MKLICPGAQKSTKRYLQIFNGLLRLTPKELDVLAAFVDAERRLRARNVPLSAFSSDVRKRIAAHMGIGNIGIYIKALKDKGAIDKTVDGYEIKPMLLMRETVTFELR